MSEKDRQESRFETALEGSMRLIAEQNKHTNEKLEGLTTAVQALVETSIKSEERHKQYDDRFERIEETQKEQGQKQEHQSEAIIEIGKDLERGVEWRKSFNKVMSGVAISVISAVILASIVMVK